MEHKILALVVLVSFGVAGCASNRALSKGQIKDVWERPSDNDYVRVRGIGAAPDSEPNKTKRRGLARNAALVAARYEALAMVRGVRVTGGLTIGQLEEQGSQIKEVADRIVSGFEETLVEWSADDGCVVLLELKRAKLEKILRENLVYERRYSRPWETVKSEKTVKKSFNPSDYILPGVPKLR